MNKIFVVLGQEGRAVARQIFCSPNLTYTLVYIEYNKGFDSGLGVIIISFRQPSLSGQRKIVNDIKNVVNYDYYDTQPDKYLDKYM